MTQPKSRISGPFHSHILIINQFHQVVHDKYLPYGGEVAYCLSLRKALMF